jgi:hypothetical protein
MMQNWWWGISGMRHWGMSPTSIPVYLQTRQVHRNHTAPCDYTYTGSSGKQGSYILSLPRHWGSSDSTSCDITKASKQHRLEDTL